MKYDNITRAKFISRSNRFIAEVEINGRKEIVHVKNTGRCKELLIRGAEVFLTEPKTSGRKTRYDLVAVLRINNENYRTNRRNELGEHSSLLSDHK